MFHALVYNLPAAAAGASNSDMVAATEADFTQKNSHYILTESFSLIATALVGASIIRGRYLIPTWNGIGEAVIFNANRALQPPSNPQYDLYEAYSPKLPMNEEIQVQASNNLGAATEIENALLLVAPDGYSTNLPRGKLPLVVRASFTVTPTLNAWSGPQALAFVQSLRGGVYAVCGAVCQGSNSMAFRLIFPRAKLAYGTRKLRPGWLTQNAIGDVVGTQMDPWVLGFGEWGRFHTFEPPQVEVFGTAAASTTYQLFLWLVYLGEDTALLQQGA